MDKPLHVRVAEALGTPPRKVRVKGTTDQFVTIWSNNPYYSDGTHDAATLRAVEVPRYDTDWSATGPLIERYRLHIEPDLCHEPRWLAFKAEGEDFPEGTGASPLEAVCHCILALQAADKLTAPAAQSA